MNRATRTVRELHDLVSDLATRMDNPTSIGARPQRMAAIESQIIAGIDELGGIAHLPTPERQVIATRLEAIAALLHGVRGRTDARNTARADLLLTMVEGLVSALRGAAAA